MAQGSLYWNALASHFATDFVPPYPWLPCCFIPQKKVCDKLTEEFTAVGCKCECKHTWNWWRGLIGYKYTCTGPRPATNLFCVDTNCGDYSVSREFSVKGVILTECAVPQAGAAAFGRSCAEIRASSKEVTGCDYFVDGTKCEKCVIGKYGPQADCTNVANHQTFTGFLMEASIEDSLGF
jgi:hypothetical protein